MFIIKKKISFTKNLKFERNMVVRTLLIKDRWHIIGIWEVDQTQTNWRCKRTRDGHGDVA